MCTQLNRVGLNSKGFNMNIELDEVVVQDVSDDALELAAGGAQGGLPTHYAVRLGGTCYC